MTLIDLDWLAGFIVLCGTAVRSSAIRLGGSRESTSPWCGDGPQAADACSLLHAISHRDWRFADHPRHQGEVDYHDFRRSLIAELRTAVPHRTIIPANR